MVNVILNSIEEQYVNIQIEQKCWSVAIFVHAVGSHTVNYSNIHRDDCSPSKHHINYLLISI